MHLTSFDLTLFVENVSRPLFFGASAVYRFIMQRLKPNNYRTSYKHTYPSLKSPFPVLVLVSLQSNSRFAHLRLNCDRDLNATPQGPGQICGRFSVVTEWV
jgi:hypothetical protein